MLGVEAERVVGVDTHTHTYFFSIETAAYPGVMEKELGIGAFGVNVQTCLYGFFP
jgi:hypothetical protein